MQAAELIPSKVTGKRQPIKLEGYGLIGDQKPEQNTSPTSLDLDTTRTTSDLQDITRNTDTRSGTPKQVRKASSCDNGVYVMGLVQGDGRGEPVHFLVDTGASTSVLSLTTYDRMPQEHRPPLKPTTMRLAGVTGNALQIAGAIEANLVFDGIVVLADILVVDIPVEAILGQDILMEHQGKLDLSNLTLRLKNATLKCWVANESVMTCRVVVKEKTSIPAWTEKLVPMTVMNQGYLAKHGYIQPYHDIATTRELLIIPGVVSTRDSEVYVRVVNFGNKDATLHSSTNVATCQSVYMNDTEPDDTGFVFTTHEVPAPGGDQQNLDAQLQDLLDINSEFLTEDEKAEFALLLKKYKTIFAASKKDLGRTNLVKHRINTGTAPPVRKPPPRLPLGKRQVEKDEIHSMLERGVIQPSTSPWASPVVLVTKKDGSTRFCVDYRALNDLTLKDAYPLPRIDDSLDALSGGMWFSTMDLMSGYWQILMDPTDMEKTAFTTCHGLYEFKVMPFGLANAPATFERLMESILRGLQWEECLVYMDDIIVSGRTLAESLERLDHVFERLQAAGLKLKTSKCSFFRRSVKFLGHIVSENGVHTDPEKVEHVKDWPVPKSPKEVRSFIGLCSYYRKFISGFAQIARPLHKLTEKEAKFIWDEACEASFNQLKEALVTAPVLAYPRPEGQFILDTDSSGWAVGAVLSQVQDNAEKVIAYFSKALSKAEQDYCVTRKELLAVVLALENFHPYVYGREVIVRTDNAAVSWMKSLRAPTGQTARWLERVQPYNLIVQHRQGRSHTNADALSRKPCASCIRQQTIEEQVQQEQQQAEDTTVKDSASVKASFLPGHGTEDEESEGIPIICVTTRGQAAPMGEFRTNQAWLQGWEVETLRLSQLEDSTIGPLLTSKEEENSKPSWREISHLSDSFKCLWAQWDRLEVRSGLLFRRTNLDKTGRSRLQLLVPETKHREVFQHLHEHCTAGHLGTERTKEKIQFAFYWPGLPKTVKDMCRKCDKCAARKPSLKRHRAPLQQYLVGNPMERIAVDILGPLPKTRRGNTSIVVLGDYFTKWMEAFAVPNQEAETVATVLVEQFVCRFGVPRQLHTDRGTNFESDLFQQVCRLLDIDKTRTTSRRPQSDGMVERFNRTLECMLTMYVEKHQNCWDEYLPYVMLAYRSSVHESTGFSPSMLMLGRELQMPLHTVIPTPQLENNDGQEAVDYVADLQDTLQEVHAQARRSLGRSAQYQKKQYDHRASDRTSYQPGTLVWYYNHSRRKGRCPKLSSPWTGPYTIVQKIDDVSYRIQRNARSQSFVCHVDALKRYEGEGMSWMRTGRQ